jgi:hypothetical protein
MSHPTPPTLHLRQPPPPFRMAAEPSPILNIILILHTCVKKQRENLYGWGTVTCKTTILKPRVWNSVKFRVLLLYPPPPPPPPDQQTGKLVCAILGDRQPGPSDLPEPMYSNPSELSPYFMEPRNRFQEMNSASLCSQAGQFDNPIPTRFLAPIDCLKITALMCFFFSQIAPFTICSNRRVPIRQNRMFWSVAIC